ncbi:MAG: enoyl-CoA hydratase/isomerase family protein [Rhodospirillaceae bacterium]|jgi:enoyl-CoA hydratase/carnithine racemase|nr:enoyl-CoA hydratase/isomerase family protein [Rhodospirillaceae bacterium]MBT5665343.1 enoyl-CoA hydratase/isomerase family protein [Rhodospirillaceae bacterium]MBT5810921.1 enoyl-CoA hydratase/isomerase family protein [Rhodospirillaceae bacterium]
MAQQIQFERKGPFAHITFNRPKSGNPINDAMLTRLTAIMQDLGRQDDLRAVVLRGAGADFCTGRERGKGKPPGAAPDSAYVLHGKVMARILAVYKAFRDCPAPIISVIQGRALGFGCALVGGSDVAIAGEAARFSLPEMTHGTAPTLAMSALTKVSPKALADMIYSMDEIDAETALATGLVGRVVPTSALDETVDALLARMMEYDIPQIRTVKRFIARGLTLDPETTSDLAGYTLATLNTRAK